jgi:hypothetical protein
MKYLCLAYEEQRVLDDLSVAEWEALRDETLAYVESLRASDRLIDTQPLQSAATAATVRVRNGKVAVTDGPFAETKEQIGGFFLIEAADLDEAVRIAAEWPSARLGTIEVRPLEDGLPTDRRYRPGSTPPG